MVNEAEKDRLFDSTRKCSRSIVQYYISVGVSLGDCE